MKAFADSVVANGVHPHTHGAWSAYLDEARMIAGEGSKIMTDEALAPMIEAEMTHRDLDGNKGDKCIRLRKYSEPITK